MITVAVDLCLTEGSVAVGRNSEFLSCSSWGISKIHAERVYAEIDHCLEVAGYKRSDISKVIVTSGPGSFTGVRLSVTVGKAFKCCGIPVFSINTLKVLSSGYEKINATIIPVIYAKRKRFYALIENTYLDATEEEIAERISKLKNPLIIYKGNPPELLIKEFPHLEEKTPLAKKLLFLPESELQELQIFYLREHDAKSKNPPPNPTR